MKQHETRTIFGLFRRGACAAAIAAVALGPIAARAANTEPVRIGVFAAVSNPFADGMMKGAILGAEQINAAGGIDGRKVELFKYDDHGSATEGVRVFQRAARQDHVVAVIGGVISEVDLAVMPWAARLHMPYITGGASNNIATLVHKDYSRYRYVFQQSPNSYYLAQAVCGIAHDVLVDHFGFRSAVIMSEDLDWTKPLDRGYEGCLPKAGLKVLDVIRFSAGTGDFTPIYNKIEALHAGVIIGGLAHVGVKATVQWHDQHVPALLAGFNGQAGASNFWQHTNGATEGAITWSAGAPGAALTDKSVPFAKAFEKRFGSTPNLEAYLTYDSMHALKQAIERAHSTRPDAIVAALGKTDLVGTTGRMEFYGPHARFTHDVKYGKRLVSGVGIQWQHGKEIAIWPQQAANGAPILPSFVKAPTHG